jgi:transcriptional regulator of acetoin/glycerol metabolism
VVLSTGPTIDHGELLLSKLPTAGDTGEITLPGVQACSLADMERQHIMAILQHTAWNKSRAATILGIERSTLDRKIRRYLLSDEFGKQGGT